MKDQAPEAPLPGARRAPVQQRSAERREKLLACARDLIAERGAESLKMAELAARAGISIGSLYQYFADRSGVVAALADRYNAEGRRCVAEMLAPVQGPEDLVTALRAMADGYYAMVLEEPVIRDIWAGALADKSLQSIDEEDIRAHGRMIAEAMARAAGGGDFAVAGQLAATLTTAVVRQAVALGDATGRAVMEAFDRDIVPALARLPADGR